MSQDEKQLLPSILDRLLTEDTGTDAPSRYQLIEELKESVRRDLQALLNSRARPLTWSPLHTELEHSILNYGTPDLSSTKFASEEDLAAFQTKLAEVIKAHEPRFSAVEVVESKKHDGIDRTIRLSIKATLHANEIVKEIVFDSDLEPVTKKVNVRQNRT